MLIGVLVNTNIVNKNKVGIIHEASSVAFVQLYRL